MANWKQPSALHTGSAARQQKVTRSQVLCSCQTDHIAILQAAYLYALSTGGACWVTVSVKGSGKDYEDPNNLHPAGEALCHTPDFVENVQTVGSFREEHPDLPGLGRSQATQRTASEENIHIHLKRS